MTNRTKGMCRYCGKQYTRMPMAKHLQTCKGRALALESIKNEKQAGYFDLLINDKYNKQYWLVVEIKDTASLRDLDQFLRDIWLECCGHLSGFIIDGVHYESDAQLADEWMIPVKGMNVKLQKLLEPGMVFDHQYDYGSTTELTLTVIEHRMGPARKDKVMVLARNLPVTYVCETCKKNPATVICLACIDEGGGLLCGECRNEHECDEGMYVKICNSPRTGVCGYDGSTRYPD